MANRKRRKRHQAETDFTTREESWREFEKLVSRIERVLSPMQAVIRSPDKLKDFSTGAVREVDASIRYKIGATEILIIVECRERNKAQDILWIEQLATKQRDLRAAKCVAVTSNGFTKAAIKKAEALGIELRLLTTVSEDVVRNWAPLRTWFYNCELRVVDLSFGTEDSEHLNDELDREINKELCQKYSLEDRFLMSKFFGPPISPRQYVMHLFNLSYSEMSDEEKLNIELNKEHIMSLAGPPEYFIECSLGCFDIICVGWKPIRCTLPPHLHMQIRSRTWWKGLNSILSSSGVANAEECRSTRN